MRSEVLFDDAVPKATVLSEKGASEEISDLDLFGEGIKSFSDLFLSEELHLSFHIDEVNFKSANISLISSCCFSVHSFAKVIHSFGSENCVLWSSVQESASNYCMLSGKRKYGFTSKFLRGGIIAGFFTEIVTDDNIQTVGSCHKWLLLSNFCIFRVLSWNICANNCRLSGKCKYDTSSMFSVAHSNAIVAAENNNDENFYSYHK